MKLNLRDIADHLRYRGVETKWNPAGTSRGREINPRPEAIILHDTVTTRKWTEANTWNLLTNGRAGLPGPLANLSPDRTGVVWLVANGRANHNGYGKYDNDSIGVEVQCAGGLKGYEEPWNLHQQEVTVILCRVLRGIYGELPILGHKESDPKRKIDPYAISMDSIRQRVTAGPTEEDDLSAASDTIIAKLNGLDSRVARIEEHLTREVPATGTATKDELDLLRKDMRQIGTALKFTPLS